MKQTRALGWYAAALMALGAAACGGKKPLATIDPASDVSGHWQLNEQDSDNAADKIAAGLPSRDHGTGGESGGAPRGGGEGGGGGRWGGGGGRGGRGGMRGGGGGGSMSAADMARRRQRAELTIDLARDVSEDLDVRVTPGAARFIRHGMMDTLDVRTDGEKMKTKIPQGDDAVEITTRATWSSGWLVVTRDVDGGGKVTETYLRSTDGRRLYVVVQLELPRFGRGRDDGASRTIEFRQVYDPATGG